MDENEKKCEHFDLSGKFDCELVSKADQRLVHSYEESVNKNQPMGGGVNGGSVRKERSGSKRDIEGKPATAFGYRKSLSAAVTSSKELFPSLQSKEEFYGPARPRRNSLANSAGYLRKLSVNACNKTATSMKRITVFTNFKKALTSSDEYNPVITPLNGAVSLTRPPSIYNPRKNGTISPCLMGNSCDKVNANCQNNTFGAQLQFGPKGDKTELEKTDPDYVKYFQDNVSQSDKEFIRKYIELKQNLEEKLEQLDSEYTKLLGLTSNADLECKLDTLDSTYGDDLIFHCVNLFESHEAPEKVMALSAHRDFENYLRTLHSNVFTNVFNIINLKTLQNSIRDSPSSSSSWKKNTQVYESNIYKGETEETFSAASFLCPISTSRERPGERCLYNYDVALAVLEDLAEERIDPLMKKAALVPNVSCRQIKHISKRISIMCESFERPDDSITPVPNEKLQFVFEDVTECNDVTEPKSALKHDDSSLHIPLSETCSTLTDLDFELIN